MPNRTNFRGGDTMETDFLVDSTNFPFYKGDLLFKDPADGYVKSSNYMSDEGDAAANRAYFALHFAGVSLEQIGMPAGTRTFRVDQNVQTVCRVATAGDFEFGLNASTALKAADWISIYGTASGAADPQKVAVTGVANEMIGQAVPGVYGLQNSTTRTVVRINARVMATYAGTSGT